MTLADTGIYSEIGDKLERLNIFEVPQNGWFKAMKDDQVQGVIGLHSPPDVDERPVKRQRT
jgi:hypothetical protein